MDIIDYLYMGIVGTAMHTRPLVLLPGKMIAAVHFMSAQF